MGTCVITCYTVYIQILKGCIFHELRRRQRSCKILVLNIRILPLINTRTSICENNKIIVLKTWIREIYVPQNFVHIR